MTNNYVEFKKQRDLGEIIKDTFAFLRDQFKPFFKTFFTITGPYLLFLLLAYAYYFYSFNSYTTTIMYDPNGFDSFGRMGSIFISVLVLYIALSLAYVVSHATTLYYIRSYANNKGTADFQTVKKDVYQNFWSFIGLGFLVGLSLMFGFMLCVIPGIYLMVPLSLSFAIMVYNRKNVGDSYSYSFTLVKDYWWQTFGNFIVVGIIVAIAGYAFSMPAVIYSWMKMGIFSYEMDAESMMDGFIDPVYIILNLLSVVFQYVLNLIMVIALILIYFDLNEKKNFTGTYELIDNLGGSEDN